MLPGPEDTPVSILSLCSPQVLRASHDLNHISIFQSSRPSPPPPTLTHLAQSSCVGLGCMELPWWAVQPAARAVWSAGRLKVRRWCSWMALTLSPSATWKFRDGVRVVAERSQVSSSCLLANIGTDEGQSGHRLAEHHLRCSFSLPSTVAWGPLKLDW